MKIEKKNGLYVIKCSECQVGIASNVETTLKLFSEEHSDHEDFEGPYNAPVGRAAVGVDIDGGE